MYFVKVLKALTIIEALILPTLTENVTEVNEVKQDEDTMLSTVAPPEPPEEAPQEPPAEEPTVPPEAPKVPPEAPTAAPEAPIAAPETPIVAPEPPIVPSEAPEEGSVVASTMETKDDPTMQPPEFGHTIEEITKTPPIETTNAPVYDPEPEPTPAPVDYESQLLEYKGRPIPPELEELFNKQDKKEDELHYCMREMAGCLHVHKSYPFCGQSEFTKILKSFFSICEMMYLNCKASKTKWHYYYEGPCNAKATDVYDVLYKMPPAV